MENNNNENSILNFIQKNQFRPINTLTLEEEFAIRQFQHMYNTVKIFLINKASAELKNTDTDLMVNIVNINKEVSEYMKQLLTEESEKFMTLYEKAYKDLYSEE